MSSSMEMWDDALPFCGVAADVKCKRCGRTIRNPAPNKRYCSERCRKRAIKRAFRSGREELMAEREARRKALADKFARLEGVAT